MKKLIALLMALLLVFCFAACGSSENEKTEPENSNPVDTSSAVEEVKEKPTATPEPTAESEPETQLTVHENTFFTVGYNEEDGWSVAEDDIYTYENGGSVYVRVLNEEGTTDIVVSIYADVKEPDSFRKNLYINGIDMQAYAAGEIETVDVGGQPMLYVDQANGDRFFFGRNEAAGVTYTIDATNWEDPRVPALIEGITCTADGTDNSEPPWPWEGEAFTGSSMSQMIGERTVTAEFVPMSEALTTFETFNHEVEIIGDKVYLLSDYVLREYTYDGTALTFVREIPVDEEFDLVENSNGTIVLSGFMKPVTGHDGEAVVYSYDGPDKFTVAPDGTWGISWFTSGETTEKYTFAEGALTGEAFPFNEVDLIRQINIDDTYIYVSGSSVEDDQQYVFVYDYSGALQLQLGGEPDAPVGLGSITYVTKTANGFLAMDGNMRSVVLWNSDGTWLGDVDDSDLFGTNYPWFATGDAAEDGSVLVVMTEDRTDGSAMEAVAFKLTVS